MQKARISLASADIGQINEICTSIKDIAEKTKVKMFQSTITQKHYVVGQVPTIKQ